MTAFFALTTGLLIGLVVGYFVGVAAFDAHIKQKENSDDE